MKPAVTALPRTLARALVSAPELAFPARATLPTLRKLREKHFLEGRHDLALQVALEVARREPGRESLFKVGFLSREVGRYRDALKALRDALRFDTGPKYLVPEIHLHLAFTWFLMKKSKRMGESLRRAYALRPKPRTAFNFHMTYGASLLEKRKHRDAAEEYARAESAARGSLARGNALVNQGIALQREGLLSEARRPLDRALAILKRAGSRAHLAVARTVRGSVCFDEGQFRRAMGMFEHAARGFRKMGKGDREAEALVNAGYAAGEIGLWARSTAFLDRAISLASSTGQYTVLAPAYACRAVASAYNEEFDEAARNIAQSGRLIRGRRDWVATLHLCRAQTKVAALMGRWREVFRAARQGERLAKKVGDLRRVAEFRRLRASAEERLGRGKAAVMARTAASRVEALLEGPSEGMKQLRKVSPKLATSGLSILLVGESGSGLLEQARSLHQGSARAKGPCVVVACEHLVFPASDLGGHAEGAWSGALRSSVGQAAQAEGGTLILDRVDLLAPDGQQVLLRIVDGKIRPVGQAEERAVDVRIVATCTSPDRLIPALRRRLEGAVLRLPGMRDRRQEILKTVRDRLAARRRITADALAVLAGHRWEGDLPEVRAVVDRLVAMSDGSIGKNLVRSVLMPTETRRVAARVDASRMSRLAAALAR